MDFGYCVYVCDVGDIVVLVVIGCVLCEVVGFYVWLLFVYVDVCCDDLLVEIEVSVGYVMEWLL